MPARDPGPDRMTPPDGGWWRRIARSLRRLEARAVQALADARARARPVWLRLRARLRPAAVRAGSRMRNRAAPLGAYWPPPLRHVLIAAGVVVVLGFVVWERCGLAGCPDVDRLAAYQPGGAPVVLDRSGEEITRLAPFSRDLVSLEDLPDHVADAFLAVEDQRFYEHGAVDWRRAAGSLLANLRAGGVAQGFSTITMQLARNVFPDRLPGQERTIRRKVLEVRVAGDIEDRFTKDEILELYLNHIYFGGATHGVAAAARGYFGKPADQLTLAEAATLAAMPKAPNTYNPRDDPERARERRDLVLSLMAEQGRIGEDEAGEATDSPIRTIPERPPPEAETPPAPYFVRAVRRSLEARLGDAMYAAPLRIHTTLDLDAQDAAERALRQHLAGIEGGRYGRFRGEAWYGQADGVDDGGTRYLQGAIVIIDPATGDVLALVGGRDYQDSPFDRATRSRRQVGSAFKPFVYAAALDDGYAPSQHLTDEPLRMELAGGEIWEPRNFTGVYDEDLTLREAVVRSNNVATVRLAMAVGLDEVRRTARRMGVRSELPDLPSLALGTAGLSLLELTTAYVPLTAAGETVQPRFVRRVEGADGDVVWEPEPDRREALPDGVAWLTTDLLRDAVERGTGSRVRNAGFNGPAAGKTGTTDDGHDAWFVGYTPDLVAGVWIGFDRPAPITTNASGGRLAAPLWGRVMRDVYRNRPVPEPWERPEEIVERDVDPVSGLVLADGCRPESGNAITEVFLESELPATVCPAGERDDPGVLGRIGSAVEGFFDRVGGFVSGLFDDDEEELEREERDRYLGRPRLPRDAGETVDPDTIDPPEPLGVPLDSIDPGYGDIPVQIQVDSLDPAVDPAVDADTLPVPQPDTLPADTVANDTAAEDTLGNGTTAGGLPDPPADTIDPGPPPEVEPDSVDPDSVRSTGGR